MKNIISIILTAVLFASCEDVIEVELKDQDQDLYAIEAKITTTNEPWVFIAKTLPVTVDQEPQGISNAIVTIADDQEPSNVITLEEDSERKGYYTVPEYEDYFGVAGRIYTLSIFTYEGVTISATETLSAVEKIDSIQIRPSLRGAERFLGVFTYGKETPGLGDYYKWDVYINDTLLHEAINMAFASDEFVDGNYIEGLEIFTDFHDPKEESERKIKLGDTVYIHQTSISEFANNFYYQMINQASTGSMFSVPPANVYGNFSASDGNVVYGIFTAHDISVSNTIIIDENIENQLKKD